MSNGMKSRALVVTISRTLQALLSLATIVAVFLTFDSFVFTDNHKVYRFITIPMMFTLIVGTAGFLFAFLYSLFVLALDRIQADILVERIFDLLLALTFVLCGSFMVGLGGCASSDPSQFHCSTYSATMALSFLSAVCFAFSLIHSLLTMEIPHPDSIENLVPRGNYGRASSPYHGHAVGPSPQADDTLTIMPRGKFGSVQQGQPRRSSNEDNTDELVPRGKFGSIV
ncbi:hypothetical protein THRCLA_02038 [Thraustotheca clavata]|uniref:MARVEL domain-containing protein n=1 Tax=Thraustotheca clavata TaxID=74557 RepID=A0A1W0A6D9_9STRA|nr:hypothetical protein THRCLA_02038 [Thraustotheca clavata]